MNKYICTKCGSPNIENKAWINTNTREIIEDCVFDEQDVYCNGCLNNTRMTLKEDYSQKKEIEIGMTRMEVIKICEEEGYNYRTIRENKKSSSAGGCDAVPDRYNLEFDNNILTNFSKG